MPRQLSYMRVCFGFLPLFPCSYMPCGSWASHEPNLRIKNKVSRFQYFSAQIKDVSCRLILFLKTVIE